MLAFSTVKSGIHASAEKTFPAFKKQEQEWGKYTVVGITKISIIVKNNG